MTLLLPVQTTWKRERPLFIVFCMANLIIGQIGIIWALLASAMTNLSFTKIIDQNLQNANLSVFAVSLLVTTGTILIAEYLDEAEVQKIELRGSKAVWATIAFVLVILQALLTGHLIQESLKPVQSIALGSSVEALQGFSSWSGWMQAALWFGSMVISVHIFCLSRMHRYPVELDIIRQAHIAVATEKAESMNKTSDNEKI